jgi:gluconolactonase
MKKYPDILVCLLVALLFAFTLIEATAEVQDWSFIARLNPSLEDIVPSDARVDKLADGFGFAEGPVWVRTGEYLLFSDIPANVIYRWSPDTRKVSTFLAYSGFTGTDDTRIGAPINNGRVFVNLIGTNGITLDPDGRLVFCARGDRQVVRLEADGRRTVLAKEYEGKRLNSPNDLVYKSDGSLYFTDPSTGLDESKKELPFNGVYLLKEGNLQVLFKDFPHPNGIAFSPDEKYLYVNDTKNKTITRFDVLPDDTVGNSKVIIDMSWDKADGAPDGMKVDEKGNIYCTGPGGIWILSPEGKHLGTIVTSEKPANLAFGGADMKTLFLAAHTGLYQIRLKIAGIGPRSNSVKPFVNQQLR